MDKPFSMFDNLVPDSAKAAVMKGIENTPSIAAIYEVSSIFEKQYIRNAIRLGVDGHLTPGAVSDMIGALHQIFAARREAFFAGLVEKIPNEDDYEIEELMPVHDCIGTYRIVGVYRITEDTTYTLTPGARSLFKSCGKKAFIRMLVIEAIDEENQKVYREVRYESAYPVKPVELDDPKYTMTREEQIAIFGE